MEGHVTCNTYLRLGVRHLQVEELSRLHKIDYNLYWVNRCFSFKIVILNVWKHTLHLSHVTLPRYIVCGVENLSCFHKVDCNLYWINRCFSLWIIVLNVWKHTLTSNTYLCLDTSLRLIFIGMVWTTCVSNSTWPLVAGICDWITCVASLNELGSVFDN